MTMFGVMLFQWMLAIYILGICDNMIVMYPSLGGRKAVLILSTIRGIHLCLTEKNPRQSLKSCLSQAKFEHEIDSEDLCFARLYGPSYCV